jgi:hypothetical protein
MELRDQEVTTSILIEAPAERIWSILSDFDSYSNWNPFIPRIFGEARLSATILEFVYIAPGLYLPLPMEVIVCEPGRELAWRGAVPHWFSAVCAGEHHFTIQTLPDRANCCEFSHYALLRGIVMQLGAAHIQNRVKQVHEAMNLALKERSEAWISRH